MRRSDVLAEVARDQFASHERKVPFASLTFRPTGPTSKQARFILPSSLSLYVYRKQWVMRGAAPAKMSPLVGYRPRVLPNGVITTECISAYDLSLHARTGKNVLSHSANRNAYAAATHLVSAIDAAVDGNWPIADAPSMPRTFFGYSPITVVPLVETQALKADTLASITVDDLPEAIRENHTPESFRRVGAIHASQQLGAEKWAELLLRQRNRCKETCHGFDLYPREYITDTKTASDPVPPASQYLPPEQVYFSLSSDTNARLPNPGIAALRALNLWPHDKVTSENYDEFTALLERLDTDSGALRSVTNKMAELIGELAPYASESDMVNAIAQYESPLLLTYLARTQVIDIGYPSEVSLSFRDSGWDANLFAVREEYADTYQPISPEERLAKIPRSRQPRRQDSFGNRLFV